MSDRLRPPVIGLGDRVHGKRDAMREQALAAVVIERHERVPQHTRLFRKLPRPGGVPGVDRLRRDGIGKAGGLAAEHRALRLDLETGVEGVAIEQLQAQHVQRRHEGDVRIVGDRVAQRQGAVGGELGDEPIGDWPHALVLLGQLGRGIHRRLGVVVGGGSRAGPGLLGIAIARAVLRRRHRRLVFGPDVAALDPQGPRAINADDGTGAGDLGRVVDDRALVESGQRGLDLGEPLVDFLRDLVLGELLDRDASLDAPDIGLAQHQPVEGDVARA